MFESIKLLREKITPYNNLDLVHESFRWTANFVWNPPAEDDIDQYQTLLERSLPNDYLQFLKEISNGCTLYHDSLYGQWGFKIYRIEEVVKMQENWKQNYGHKWQNYFIAFAELYGEANVLLFDLNIPSAGNSNYAVREGNPYDKVENWPIVSRSFHEWLDHLITAQGAKYWERKNE